MVGTLKMDLASRNVQPDLKLESTLAIDQLQSSVLDPTKSAMVASRKACSGTRRLALPDTLHHILVTVLHHAQRALVMQVT